MANPARILNLEDSPEDSELAQRELRRAGIEVVWLRVDGEAAFRSALDEFHPELVLADRNLPGFDGLAALEIARKHAPDTPFVFLSGTMGEDTAIDCLKSGATDYVLKSRISRLGPAVRRALAEAEEHRALRESRLREQHAEERFRRVFEQAPIGIVIADQDSVPIIANPAF
jgi:DNA-binding response OmpR family regulator